MRNVETTESTALIAVGTAHNEPPTLARAARHDAPFIAQLIATAANAPQTRTLRRGTHAEALSGYRLIEDECARPSNLNGALLSRVA